MDSLKFQIIFCKKKKIKKMYTTQTQYNLQVILTNYNL